VSRIQSQDTMLEAIVKMSDGNPGAITVMMQLLEQVPEIDPIAAMGGLLYVLHLDDFGLYGPSIWMLYKDVCGQEIAGIVTLFRARQLGHITGGELQRIVAEDKPYDWQSLVPKIQEEVPEFRA
jgi:hypothetical protein